MELTAGTHGTLVIHHTVHLLYGAGYILFIGNNLALERLRSTQIPALSRLPGLFVLSL